MFDKAAYVRYIQETFIGDCIAWSCIALLVYEYVITFEQELRVIWQRKWTGVTWLFILNRYVVLVKAVLVIMPIASAEMCSINLRFIDAFSALQYVLLAGFSALRAYALWGSNIWWFVVIAALNLITPIYSIFVYAKSKTFFIPNPVLCTDSFGISNDIVLRMILITRLAVILADALVLGSTWHKAFSTYRQAKTDGYNVPVITLMVENGIVYFSALLVLNLFTMLCENVPSLSLLTPASLFAEVVTPILIARFLLNLRQIDDQQGSVSSNQRFSQFTVAFRIPDSFVGNMGESLQFETAATELAETFHEQT